MDNKLVLAGNPFGLGVGDVVYVWEHEGHLAFAIGDIPEYAGNRKAVVTEIRASGEVVLEINERAIRLG